MIGKLWADGDVNSVFDMDSKVGEAWASFTRDLRGDGDLTLDFGRRGWKLSWDLHSPILSAEV
jgi:hypothetical protein